MVTHMGEVWLRGKTLLIVVLIGMLSSVSINGLMTLAAQADAPDAESEQSTTPTPGFTRTAVYRERAATDAKYRTDESVTSLRFVALGNDGTVVDTLGAVDKTPVDAEDYKIWVPVKTPELGVKTLKVETQVAVADIWKDQPGEIILREYPTVSVTQFNSPRGGTNLESKGAVQGVPSDIATEVSVRLVRISDGQEIARYLVGPRGADIVLANFSLTGVASGNYRLELIARSGDRDIARSDASVEIRRDPVSVNTLTISPAVIYTNTTFTIAGRINTPYSLKSATLHYGDQSTPVSIGSDRSFSYSFAPGFLAGSYTFFVIAEDEYGNTNVNAQDQQGRIIVQIATPPGVSTPTSPAAPQLPTVTKTPIKRLSTNFATPLPTSRTVSPVQVRASVRQSDADVLGSQTKEALEEAIDLRTTASTAGLPVEATHEGWKIFGHPWYWWLAGSFATIGSGVYLMRRIVRQP